MSRGQVYSVRAFSGSLRFSATLCSPGADLAAEDGSKEVQDIGFLIFSHSFMKLLFLPSVGQARSGLNRPSLVGKLQNSAFSAFSS